MTLRFTKNQIKMIKPSITTILITLAVILIIALLIFSAITTDSSIQRDVIIIVIVLIVYPILKMPLKISCNGEEIKIKQLVGTTTFRLAEFNVRKINRSDIGFTIRLFGSGGFGGFIGWFRSDKIGKYYALYTNSSKLLLLTNKETGKQYVIDDISR